MKYKYDKKNGKVVEMPEKKRDEEFTMFEPSPQMIELVKLMEEMREMLYGQATNET